MLTTAASFTNSQSRRWYRIEAGHDLFGQLIVVKRWGSTSSRRGSAQILVFDEEREQSGEVSQEICRRQKRGYLQEPFKEQ